ncbi:MAG: hypothetical protein J2P57_19850 [Acidimicrobiaceae bacterium]|nr:hypothetical protein [Acidimicrobiaceae bacterium]
MTDDGIPRDADGFIYWPAVNGDQFVEAMLDLHLLAEFVELYRRNGFPDLEIQGMIWAKARGRWQPTWSTIEGIANDQRKAADA